jgi:hypothetical protein
MKLKFLISEIRFDPTSRSWWIFTWRKEYIHPGISYWADHYTKELKKL